MGFYMAAIDRDGARLADQSTIGGHSKAHIRWQPRQDFEVTPHASSTLDVVYRFLYRQPVTPQRTLQMVLALQVIRPGREVLFA